MSNKLNITPCEFWILQLLYENPGTHVLQLLPYLKQHEMKNAASWNIATTQTFLRRLVKKGYAERIKDYDGYMYNPTKPLDYCVELILHQNLGNNSKQWVITYLQGMNGQTITHTDRDLHTMITPLEFSMLEVLDHFKITNIQQILLYLNQIENKASYSSYYTSVLRILRNLMAKGYVERSGDHWNNLYLLKRTLWEAMDDIFYHYFGSSTNTTLISYLHQEVINYQKEDNRSEL